LRQGQSIQVRGQKEDMAMGLYDLNFLT
jgi:hypothetical protein